MGDQWVRARAMLSGQFEVVVAVLLVITVAGGWVTYGAHVDPGTTTEQRQVSSWSHTGNYTHSATVTKDNPLYPVGTRLSNRSIYFRSASPVLRGTFVFSYDATDGGDLAGTIEQRVVVRSVEDRQRRTVEVWREVRGTETRSVESVTPGSAVRVPFSVNINRTVNRTELIAERLNDPPGTPRLDVFTTVSLTGTVNGRAVNRTEEFVLPVTFDRDAYRVNATAETRRFETTRTAVVPRDPGPFEAVGGPLLFGLGFVGLVVLALARARKVLALTTDERERLAFEDDRSEFDEWINTVKLPPDALDLPRARAESLGDLVDFAIDTNNSVIEDPSEETFHVFHDGYQYTYEAPPSTVLTPQSSPTDGETTAEGTVDAPAENDEGRLTVENGNPDEPDDRAELDEFAKNDDPPRPDGPDETDGSDRTDD